MKKTLFVMSILFAAACGGKSKDGGMDPCKDKKMAHMDCAGMADNVAKAMTTSGDMPADAVSQMRDGFADKCSADAWSQEAIDCMAAASNENEGESCENMLTDAQKESFTQLFEDQGEGDSMGDGMEPDEGEDGMD